MGYVYCFENDSMPGLVKIGMTERTPQERLSEANSSDTWRPPTPYTIVVAKRVNEPKEKEKKLHAFLQEERINPNREFFCVSTGKVFLLFDLMDGEYYKLPQVEGHFDEFIESVIKVTPNSKMKYSVLKDAYGCWLSANYGNGFLPPYKGLISYITKHYETTLGVTKAEYGWCGLEIIEGLI